PRDPDPRAEGRRMSGAETATASPGRASELLERGWIFTPPRSQLLDPTPADGPDPYGNPDPDWLRIDWREHLRTIELDTGAYPEATGGSTPITYLEMGPTDAVEGDAGPPIVFVHGLGGCWQNWLENIPHFARRHRVVALELPGFGHSPLPIWDVSIEGLGRILLSFCRNLGLEGAVVVGNSMGGFISAEAAIQ